MAFEKRPRRKASFSGSCDPRTHVASGFVTYVEQFYPGHWSEIFAVTGWRPSRAVVIPRGQLDAETIRWLARYNGK
jgi:hypothetical protein